MTRAIPLCKTMPLVTSRRQHWHNWKEEKCLLSDWPPQSPDLNIIENLWAQFKRKVSERFPSNSSKLWNFARKRGTTYTMMPSINCSTPFRSA